MSDLINRLNAASRGLILHHDDSLADGMLYREAADRIEAQQRKLDEIDGISKDSTLSWQDKHIAIWKILNKERDDVAID